ncbi:hypothetical protein SCHPADRAFT_497039 [Schizopora paradoxa]|uniref:Uncharacterized protein n=1 Tax=Schizopora paradoxa TaxID=27342 RepID=A0A0H2RN60_9AGAM|nr:hypothetical protein SCHPADRAFT_497039 [Schizopora paradoxa]
MLTITQSVMCAHIFSSCRWEIKSRYPSHGRARDLKEKREAIACLIPIVAVVSYRHLKVIRCKGDATMRAATAWSKCGNGWPTILRGPARLPQQTQMIKTVCILGGSVEKTKTISEESPMSMGAYLLVTQRMHA